ARGSVYELTLSAGAADMSAAANRVPGRGQTRVTSGSGWGQTPATAFGSGPFETGTELVGRDRVLAEVVGGGHAVTDCTQDDLRGVGERAADLRALDQELRGHRRREHGELRLAVTLAAEDLVRLVDGRVLAHAFSFSRMSSLSTFGLAFPPVSF